MSEPLTLIDLLRRRAAADGGSWIYRFLRTGDADGPVDVLTLAGLDRRARAIGAVLREAGAAEQRVLLVFAPGLDFVSSFFGCLYAGATAVPVYPPRRSRGLEALEATWHDSGAAVVLTASGTELPELNGAARILTDDIDDDRAETWRPPDVSGATLALLQYTSGSTGAPKGVMVTHANLLANQEMIRQVFGHTEGETVVSWLPLYHDMGLIGCLIQPMYVGGTCVLMSPLAFAQRPLRWLQAISRFRATTSGGPNFAYDECVRRVRDADLGELDLSSWKVAFNGAEPVRASTLRRFTERFVPCGFDPGALLPCYGLAESTLLVTGARSGTPEGRVSSGRAAAGTRVAVVAASTREPCEDGCQGEIWVSGPHVAAGYWGRPEETETTFRAALAGSKEGPFLRTGDLGVLDGGELFVTGRAKDLIIVRGRNHHPQDVEQTVEACHDGVRPAGCAAFSIVHDGEERLVVAAEVKPRSPRSEIAGAIREAVARRHEIEPWSVVLERPRSLPKTSSGKIRRHACRERFMAQPSRPVGTHAGSAGILPALRPEGTAPGKESAIRDWIIERIARHLGVEPGAVDVDAPWSRFGLDSRQLVSLSGELEERFGLALDPTLLYEHPTITTLSHHVGQAVTRGARPADSVAESAGAACPTWESEAMAIVGMGCRFPGGADSPERFRHLLNEGRDAIREVPPGRWPNHAEVPVSRGGFLDRVEDFDAAFFGISPSEAISMDPQQRLLLEVAWEALENAGLVPRELAGRAAGVFLGLSTGDYARRHLYSGSTERIGSHSVTGSAMSAAAGRLSYFLRFKGPSLVVDTACSSSLVALHLACRSLRCGESDLALAGGVSLMLSPEPAIALARSGVLAPDGRSKAFDARADGYGRGEGCGVVVLKRLRDALAAGDPVVAVIRGTAVNQDGLASGLSAPNATAQREVVLAALADGGVDPAEVEYVEAHGTGTELGDPIELHALGKCLGAGREQPLVVGSVKANIGHLEAAAGVAGLIKTALVLRYGEVPPQLHFETPSPRIRWDDLEVSVPTERSRSQLRFGGVSSFGLTGTNAHAVLEAFDSPQGAEELTDRPFHVLTISARDETALRDQARRYAAFLASCGREPSPVGQAAPADSSLRDEEPARCRRSHYASLRDEEPARCRRSQRRSDTADVCFSANTMRTRFEHRLAVVASTKEELEKSLMSLVRSEASQRVFKGCAKSSRRLAFLFTGQGVDVLGAGRSFYDTQPVFHRVLDEADEVLRPLLGESLLSILYGEGPPPTGVPWKQPALVAVECALAELWRSWGVVPEYVTGHSVGEYAAACVAGVFRLEDALALLVERERLMWQLSADGAMAAIETDESSVEQALASYAGAVSVAAVNGPRQVVVSGRVEAVDEIIRSFADEGVRVRRLEVDHAFHSPLMDAMLDRFSDAASRVSYELPAIPLISCLTGQQVGEGIAHADYWRYHVRETVRFADAVRTLHEEGAGAFLELGPEATLSSLGPEVAPERDAAWHSALRRGEDASRTCLTALAELSVCHDVDWRGFDRPWKRRRVALPTYPFQRRRFWLDPPDTERVMAPDALTDLFYRVEWREAPPPAPDASPARWLLLADAGGVGAELATELEKRGQMVETIAVEDAEESLLQQDRWRGVVHLGSLDAPPPGRASVGDLESFVYDRGLRPLLMGCRPTWVVTRGGIVAAPLQGLGRALSLESPDTWAGLVDLDPEPGAGEVPLLAGVLLEAGDEDELAIRGGRLLVPRLLPAPVPAPRFPLRIRDDHVYLVTGGLGGLGVAVGRWLAGCGARHLVLTRRRALSEADHELAEAFATLGVEATVVAADVGRRDEMESLLAGLEQPLGGLVHAAGVLDVRSAGELDEDAVRAVCRPKVEGTWILHELTRDVPLDFFVLFSSAAAVWGSRGLAHYAAANRFLEGVAAHRRSLGLAATCVHWGWWAEGGMGDDETARLFADVGLRALPTPLALRALERAMESGGTTVVARVDWEVFKPIYEARRRRPLLAELGSGEVPPEEAAPDHMDVTELITREVGRVLELDEPVDPDRDLLALGLDSILAVRLMTALRSRLGRSVAPSSVFRHPTIAALTELFRQGDPAGSTISRTPRNEPAYLSFGQQRLWFFDQLVPGRALYNLHFRLEIHGLLDIAKLEHSLDAIVRRHDVQRAALRTIDAEARQVVLPEIEWQLPLVDLSGIEGPRRLRETRRLDHDLSARAFDLGSPPLFRLALVAVGQRRHTLLAVQHHAITDGWSLRLFLRELALGYRGDRIPEPEIGYADFAAWQREAWQSGAYEREAEYWREKLEGLEPLDLPYDRSRHALAPSFRGGAVKLDLEPELIRQARWLARERGRTLFALLASAFSALLQRYTAQSQLGLGTVVAGRDRPEVRDVMGFFVNTLVFRVPAPQDRGFAEHLDAVAAVAAEALEHQAIPYDRVVEALRVEALRGDRTSPEDPLIRACFMIETLPSAEVEVPELEFKSVLDTPDGAVAGTSKFDLTLSMAPSGDGMVAAFEYSSDLFDRTTIRRWSGHFRSLLAGAVASPSVRLSELAFWSRAERHQWLSEWNDTASAVRDVRVHELFEEQAQDSPERIAVVFKGSELTYRQLGERVKHILADLQNRGAGPGDLVEISLERSPEMVATLLAVSKLGGAWLPLDPALPERRRSFMKEDARADFVGGGSGLAYVLYTSGSTGRPKGVAVTHRALVNLLDAMARETGVGRDDEVVSITTLSFDIAALEIFLPLARGGRLRLVPDEVTGDPPALLATLREAQASVEGTVWLQATPSTWRMLLAADWPAGLAPSRFAALCGGEALAPDLAHELRGRASRVWNVYGPTETTIWSSSWRLPAGGERTAIGRPLGNNDVRVLDARAIPVPRASVGQLWIAGEGVARGYVQRPGLTAESFVPDPFNASGRVGRRMYRTGDLGRFLADGTLECLGRVDHQVKVRGHRIELGEVEAALHAAPGVLEGAVAVRGRGESGSRLVAYVVGSAVAPSPEALRRHLREYLPAYMVPAVFVELGALPRTANGKVDRRALPEPAGARPRLTGEPVAPRNEVEERLAALWTAMLGLDSIGVHDDFFELGGSSMEATLLVSRVREAFSVDLALASFFQATTIARLAELLESRPRTSDGGIRAVSRARYARRRGVPSG